MSSSALCRVRLVVITLIASLGLAACGGGDGGSTSGTSGGTTTTTPTTPTTPAPAGTSVPATGGTVSANGVQVVVPSGALDATTTINIEKSTTGAPAMLPGLTAAGDTFAITPHGTKFNVPVSVSLPIPTGRSLAANEKWLIAKADPNGAWVLQGNSRVVSGMVVADVSSLSLFVVVPISFQVPITAPITAPPDLRVTGLAMHCTVGDSGVCGIPRYHQLSATWTTNGGGLPTGCTNPEFRTEVNFYGVPGGVYSLNGIIPAVVGATQLTFSFGDLDPGIANARVVTRPVLELHCNQGGATPRSDYFLVRYDFGVSDVIFTPTYDDWLHLAPSQRLEDGLEIRLAPPASRTVVAGDVVDFKVLATGASIPTAYATAIKPYRGGEAGAITTWDRSDDDGKSWTTLARTLQDEADPQPYAFSTPWAYWQVSRSFKASLADDNALYRAHICYTPSTGNAFCRDAVTRLHVSASALPPTITVQPSSKLVRTGQSASFTAAADGIPTPTLQWQSRAANFAGAWTDIAGATGTTYTTEALPLGDSGKQYRVIASNGGGSTASAVATASVLDYDVAPQIVNAPSSLSVVSGSDAGFAVTAYGTAPLVYQWRRNGVAIAGATSAMLGLPGVTAANAGAYSVVVTNATGSVTSTDATLTVTAAAPTVVAPTITTQPADLTVSSGNSATFAVGVNGTGPFSYQWSKDGAPINGATAAAYTIASVGSGDAGSYRVVIRNSAGSATSTAATLTLASPILPPVTAPLLVTQPAAVFATAGQSATFAVQATGSAPLSYQWSKDGVPIFGATSAVLTIATVGNMDAGSYSVTVSNAAGSVTSNAVGLTLLGAPVITAQPTDVAGYVGNTATFRVTATGNNLRYAWLRNGVEIAGATSASYTTPTLILSDSGATYSVTVYNGAGVRFSRQAVLSVTNAPPTNLSYPSPQSWTVGTAITPISPTVTGLVASYSVSPFLPAGLSLDTTTGLISGTPTADAAQATYTITASNAGGSTTFGLQITVNAPVVGNPLSWTTPVRIDDPSRVGFWPALAGNAAGNALAAWVTNDGTTSTIWARSYSAATGTWSASPTQISGGAANMFINEQPKVAMDATGNAIIVWAERYRPTSDIGIYARYFNASTQTWETGQTELFPVGGYNGGLDLDMDAQGNLGVAYFTVNTACTAINLQYHYRQAGAPTWTSSSTSESLPYACSGIGSPAIRLANGTGKAVVTFWANWSSGASLISKTVDVVTQNPLVFAWSQSATLATGSILGNPALLVDANSKATSLWMSGGKQYSARLDASLASPIWGSATELTTLTGGSFNNQHLSLAANNDVFAVWQEASLSNPDSWYVVGRRYNVASNSWDAVQTTIGQGTDPSLRTDGNGNAVAIWTSNLGPGDSTGNVFSRKFTNGNWETNPVQVSQASGFASEKADSPRLVVSPTGLGLAIWQQWGPGSNNPIGIYYSRTN